MARLGRNSLGPASRRWLGSGQKKGKVRVWVSDGSLPLFAVGKPRVELPPGIQCLAGPDPEARRDAHDERHEVFDHVDCEVGRHAGRVVGRAGDG